MQCTADGEVLQLRHCD
uniref:Uncharacterized protein n=1 Tax=Anguilla anguilla TaxID=7936 RepID=A0A0E9TQI2_ANGAN